MYLQIHRVNTDDPSKPIVIGRIEFFKDFVRFHDTDPEDVAAHVRGYFAGYDQDPKWVLLSDGPEKFADGLSLALGSYHGVKLAKGAVPEGTRTFDVAFSELPERESI